MILSDALILLISQLQTEQVMTSQIRSNIEYLIQTYYFLVLILKSKLMKNLSIITGFNADLMMTHDSGLLFWATLYSVRTLSGDFLMFEFQLGTGT